MICHDRLGTNIRKLFSQLEKKSRFLQVEAAKYYDQLAIKEHGHDAVLHFPEPYWEQMRALQIEARKRGDFGFKVRGSSKFRGVSKKSAKAASSTGNVPSNPKRWVANINESGGQSNFLGTFADEVAAARAYDQAALRVHGYNAKLNFPSEEIAQTAQREIDAERQSTGPRVSTRKGVKWDLELCKWIVHVDGSTLAPSSRPGSDSVGLFADEDGAALAYDRAWLEKHGNISDKKQQEQLSTLLNFPEQSWAWFRQQTHQRDGSKYRGVIWARHANNGLGQWKATIQGVSYRGRRSPAESTRVLGFFEDEVSDPRLRQGSTRRQPKCT